MLAAQRRGRILSELSRDGTVRVTDLVELLGVSDMTVRRDLVALHREGLLEKVHGGALAVAEPSSSEPGFAAKSVQRRREKEAVIAAAAAELVHPGMAIAGVGPYHPDARADRAPGSHPRPHRRDQLGRVADVLHRTGEPTTSVLLTGGLRTPSDALVGPVAVSSLRSLHVDAFFMGVHGMDVRAGFSTPNLLGVRDQPGHDRALTPADRLRRLQQVGRRRPQQHGRALRGCRAGHRLRTFRRGERCPVRPRRGARLVVDPIDDEDDDLDEAGDA